MPTTVQQFLAKRVVDPLHKLFLADRHTRRVGAAVAQLLPSDRSLSGVDIGCGSGKKARCIQTLRTNVQLTGADVFVRPDAVVPVVHYDGTTLPFVDGHFDFSLLIDVIHHSDDPVLLLKEALRVSRQYVIVKDHYCDSGTDRAILTLMDWIGNRAHGIALPNNYLSRKEWASLYDECNLAPTDTCEQLGLYVQPLSCVFDANLHFISKLVRR